MDGTFAFVALLARHPVGLASLGAARGLAAQGLRHDLADLAGTGEVAGLLYQALRSARPAFEVAPGTMDALRETYIAVAADNLRRMGAVGEVLSAYAARGVDVALLKGTRLLASHYGDPGLRPMRDADLLVRAHALPDAEAALMALGYHRRGTPGRERSEARYYQRAYLRPLPPSAAGRPRFERVEVHTSLCDERRYPVDANALWANARAVTVDGHPILALDDAAHLAYVALHVALHAFDVPLSRLVDVATILHRTPALAPLAAEYAVRWRAAAAVKHVFALAHTLSGAPIDDDTWRLLRVPTLRALAVRALLRDDAIPSLRWALPFRVAQAATLWPLVDEGHAGYLAHYARLRARDAADVVFARLRRLW